MEGSVRIDGCNVFSLRYLIRLLAFVGMDKMTTLFTKSVHD